MIMAALHGLTDDNLTSEAVLAFAPDQIRAEFRCLTSKGRADQVSEHHGNLTALGAILDGIVGFWSAQL
jgi:hypothetical protein